MTQDKPADILHTCSPGPDSFYQLPFDPQPPIGPTVWSLTKGNWDDPNKDARHDTVDGGQQSYSYDFVHVNGEGQHVRAARMGRIAFVYSTQSINTVQQPNSGARGEGNTVVIRHLDGTAAAYVHLQKDKVFVEEGEYVPPGRVIALSGHTGQSFNPHLHFDVHPSFTDWDHWVPTMRIRFEDANHICWRPHVGTTLTSTNMVPSVPFAALFGPGSGVQSFLAGLEFDEFVAAWVNLGTTTPVHDMKIFGTYVEGGKRRFAGLFGPGKGGQEFHSRLEFQPFVDKWVELGSKTPKKDMLAFDTFVEGGKRRFAGLFGPGKGGQEFHSGLDFDTLASNWVKAKQSGRRLISVVAG